MQNNLGRVACVYFFSSLLSSWGGENVRKNLLMAGNLLNSSHESLILHIIHFNLSISESDFAFLFAFMCRVLWDNLFRLSCDVDVVDEDLDISFCWCIYYFFLIIIQCWKYINVYLFYFKHISEWLKANYIIHRPIY